MSDAPQRIWIDTFRNTGQWVAVAGANCPRVDADFAPSYILATPEALAASPEVQALIADAVALERERCAAIAGDYSAALTVEAKLWLKDKMLHAASVAAAQATAGERIAAAIRAITPPADLADRVKGGGE